jgi:hypothetical protein
VVFLAVSVDENRALVRPFVQRNNYRLSFGYDTDALKSFGVGSVPVVFMIDRDGMIQYRDVGYGGAAERFIERLTWRIDELLKPDRLQ